MFMVLSSWHSHFESSPGSFDQCRTAISGRRPKTKPDDLGCESACTGCQSLHPPSPFIIITQPESWYSFYRPTEGRRLSRPSGLASSGHFTFWISLSLGPKTETKRLNFGLSPVSRLTSHRSASSLTSSATCLWFRRISLFIFELAKKRSDFRSSKLDL